MQALTNSSYWPAWLAVALALMVALNQLVTESEKFANLLGRLGRRLYARAQKRHRMDVAEFNDAVRDAVADERQRWEDNEARALKAVEGRLEYVTTVTEHQQLEMGSLAKSLRCMTAYTEYEANWHHKLQMQVVQAAKDGGDIPIDNLPTHVHYAEFEKTCLEKGNVNWRTWGI